MRLAIKSSLLGVSGKLVRVLALLLMCVIARGAMAQGPLPAAPYVLPYNATTLVGGVPNRTALGQSAPYNVFPQPCAPGLTLPQAGTALAFDDRGDGGCPGYLTNPGNTDIHDIYVDGFGQVWWDDNVSAYRRYDPRSGTSNVYVGAAAGSPTTDGGLGGESSSTACPNSDTAGDGCLASDGIANWLSDCSPTSFATYPFTCTALSAATVPPTPYVIGGVWQGYAAISGKIGARGIALAPDGDFLLAAYSQSTIFRVNYVSDVLGNLVSTTAGETDGGKASVDKITQARGVAEDGLGNVWIAETSINDVREIPNVTGGTTVDGNTYAPGGTLQAGNIYMVAGLGALPTFTPGCAPATGGLAGTGFGTTQAAGANQPEGIRVDTFGNVYVDGGYGMDALYEGSGYIVDQVPPYVANTWYDSVGFVGPACNTTHAGGSSSTPTAINSVEAGNIFQPGGIRKFGIDNFNNLYIPNGSSDVYFVDHITGYIRIIAGSTSTSTTLTNCGTGATTPVYRGDGCPGGQTSTVFQMANGNATPDGRGNLYVGDTNGATVGTTLSVNNSRIREVTNGLNFIGPVYTAGIAAGLNATGAQQPGPIPVSISTTTPPVVGASVTQTIMVHVNPVACPVPFNYTTCEAEGVQTSPPYNMFGVAPTVPGATFSIVGSPDFTIPAATQTILTTPGGYQAATNNPPNPPTPATGILSESLTSSPKPMNADGTIDYLVQVTFKPTKPGLDTASLVVTTASGLKSSFPLTGVGGGPSVAIDPGSVTAAGATSPYVTPAGIFADAAGNYYIADKGANKVFLYNSINNQVTVLAGTGTAGYRAADDGAAATAAELNGPLAVTADAAGNVFIADTGNNRIRRVDASTGIITTYAGGGNGTFCPTAYDTLGDGCPAAAIPTTPVGGFPGGYAGIGINGSVLNAPSGVAMDLYGNLFVSDTGNNKIRRITNTDNAAAGVPYIFAFAGGNTTCPGASDGIGDGCTVLGTTSTFSTGLILSSPQGLALDKTSSNLYVADTGNNAVRSINITTTLGSLIASPNFVTAPTGVSLDAAGNVYIADSGNDDIRVVPAVAGMPGTYTLMGNFGFPGTGLALGTTPAPTAVQVQLGSSPVGGVAVSAIGTLVAADPGNHRVLLDNRTSTAYAFGNTATNSTLLPIPFTELSTGNVTAALGTPLFSTSLATSNPPFVENQTPAPANACVSGTTLAPGTSCAFTMQFAPQAPATNVQQTGTYTESAATVANPNLPSIVITGTSVARTASTTTFAQTVPATGSPSFGIPLQVLATVAPSAATGFVALRIDGVLAPQVALAAGGTATLSAPATMTVGSHIVLVEYFGDGTYAGSSSAPQTFTVTPPATTTTLTLTPATAPQFTAVSYLATLQTNPSGLGIPSGTVLFVNSSATPPVVLASVPLGPATSTTSTASFNQSLVLNSNSTVNTNTLLPGTYNITAYYNCVGLPSTITCPSTDPGFVGSSATQVLTVQPQTVVAGTTPPNGFFLVSKPCNAADTLLLNSGVGSAVLPLFTCANDPGFPNTNVTTGSAVALTGGIATPSGASTGTAGGNMTSLTVCPYSQTNAPNYQTVVLTLPIDTTHGGNCQALGALDPHNFEQAVVFNETNSFTIGETVTVTGATTSVAGSANNAQIYNVTYKVIQATGTQWSGLLTSYVATGQGASIDATVFILPANTLSGTLSFSCANLPANSACTFNPTVITLTPNPATPSVGHSAFIPLTITFFTDLQPGETNSQSTSLHAPAIPGHKASGVTLALLLGWPVTLLGLAGLIRFRKRKGLASSFTLTALLFMALGSSVLFTAGCGGGPGAYKANLTPTGVYPVVVTVTNGTVTQSLIVDLAIFPGTAGSE